MPEEYLSAAVPTSTTLLGLKLRPLCISSLLLLERFECLPACDEDRLIMAVLICSSDPEKFVDNLEDPFLKLRIKWWRWRLGEVDWAEKFALWEAYFEAGTKAPLVVPTDEKRTNMDSQNPFLQHLRTVLISKCNYTLSEAMTTNLSQCLWDFYSWAEAEGSVKIVDREKSKETQEWVKKNHDDLIKRAKEISAREKEAAHGA